MKIMSVRITRSKKNCQNSSNKTTTAITIFCGNTNSGRGNNILIYVCSGVNIKVLHLNLIQFDQIIANMYTQYTERTHIGRELDSPETNRKANNNNKINSIFFFPFWFFCVDFLHSGREAGRLPHVWPLILCVRECTYIWIDYL